MRETISLTDYLISCYSSNKDFTHTFSAFFSFSMKPQTWSLIGTLFSVTLDSINS